MMTSCILLSGCIGSDEDDVANIDCSDSTALNYDWFQNYSVDLYTMGVVYPTDSLCFTQDTMLDAIEKAEELVRTVASDGHHPMNSGARGSTLSLVMYGEEGGADVGNLEATITQHDLFAIHGTEYFTFNAIPQKQGISEHWYVTECRNYVNLEMIVQGWCNNPDQDLEGTIIQVMDDRYSLDVWDEELDIEIDHSFLMDSAMSMEEVQAFENWYTPETEQEYEKQSSGDMGLMFTPPADTISMILDSMQDCSEECPTTNLEPYCLDMCDEWGRIKEGSKTSLDKIILTSDWQINNSEKNASLQIEFQYRALEWSGPNSYLWDSSAGEYSLEDWCNGWCVHRVLLKEYDGPIPLGNWYDSDDYLVTDILISQLHLGLWNVHEQFIDETFHEQFIDETDLARGALPNVNYTLDREALPFTIEDGQIVANGYFAYSGAPDDYSVVLANCSEEVGDMGEPTLDCDENLMTVRIIDAMANTEEAVVDLQNYTGIALIDEDGSDTLSHRDSLLIGGNTGNWTHIRLYSASADAYSDENPILMTNFKSVREDVRAALSE